MDSGPNEKSLNVGRSKKKKKQDLNWIFYFLFSLSSVSVIKQRKKKPLGELLITFVFLLLKKVLTFFFFFRVVSFCFVGYYKNSRGNMMVGWRGRGGGIKERKLSCVGRRCVISLNILQNIFFFFRLLLFCFLTRWKVERVGPVYGWKQRPLSSCFSSLSVCLMDWEKPVKSPFMWLKWTIISR